MEEYNRRVSQHPLAERLRPKSLSDFVGQKAALIANGPLARLVSGDISKTMSSVILWGPPGSGKTTLARMISHADSSKYVELSAVDSSVSQVRDVINEAMQMLSSKPVRDFIQGQYQDHQ